MAVAVAEPSTSVDFVTGAVVANYRARVEAALEVTIAELMDAPSDVGAVRAVMAPASHLVEVVLDDETPLESMAGVAWRLERDGLHLNVLVGLARLGEAHTELRGAPCTLQGWWFEDDDVHFAGFERP
jgi:hypothetical protein